MAENDFRFARENKFLYILAVNKKTNNLPLKLYFNSVNKDHEYKFKQK